MRYRAVASRLGRHLWRMALPFPGPLILAVVNLTLRMLAQISENTEHHEAQGLTGIASDRGQQANVTREDSSPMVLHSQTRDACGQKG